MIHVKNTIDRSMTCMVESYEMELEYKAVSNKSTQAHGFAKVQRMRVEKVYLNIVGFSDSFRP